MFSKDRKTDSVSSWAIIFIIGVFFDVTLCSSAQTHQPSREKPPFFTFRVTDINCFVSSYLSTKINGGTTKTTPVVVFTAIGNFSIFCFFTFWRTLGVFGW
jgi:hypothetical protein